MKPSLKKSVLLALVILQSTSLVYAQHASGDGLVGNAVSSQQQPESVLPTSDTTPPATTAAPPAATTTTTVDPPKPTTEQPKPTSDQPPAQTTTKDVPATTANPTVAPSSDTPAPTSNSIPAPTTDSRKPGRPTTNNNNTSDNPTGAASGTAPTPSSSSGTSSSENTDPPSNKTAVIAGSVVGGLVGIALIAGFLTWLNRRGGCTSRTRRRDAQANYDAGHDDFDMKMTDSHNMGGASAGMVGVAGAMHSSDNLAAASPFQHARRFVPPTSNPTGYLNLNDEEYGYHQNTNTAAYQPQQGGYHDYNNAASGYHDGSHPDYNQDYQHDYYNQQQQPQQDYAPHHEYDSHDYAHHPEGSINGSSVGYQQAGGAYYNGHVPGSNVTSPTLTNAPTDGYRQQLKPDQIEQKPNAA